MTGKHVLVTTRHRGVFAGVLDSQDGDVVALSDAQNCVKWSTNTKGFLGLAAKGPQQGSRIGPPVPKITLYGVTSVAECTEEATQEWKSQPWS